VTLPSPRPSPNPTASDPRWTLVVAILGSGIAFLDASVIAVALPVMQHELSMTVGLAQWIVEAYSLMLASLVLVGGALGDRLGRKRVYLIGLTLFAVASAACGLAPSAIVLVAARAVQGVGAAMLVPGSLSLISAAYDDKKRGAAIGTWSAFSAITGVVGPVAGGWVVAHGSWRWLFFFNVPLAVAIVVLSRTHVMETRDDEAPAAMDWLGAALATLGLGLVVYALVNSADAGGARQMVPLLVVGLVTLVAFVIVEARGRTPMVHLALFRSRTFSGTNLLTLVLYAALGGAFFFLPFDLIQIQKYPPAGAGAALLPFVLLVAGMSRGMGALVVRVGTRPLLVVGPAVAAVGFALLARPTTGGSYWSTFFPGIVVLGVGMGLTVAPLTTGVMGAVESRHAGVASGINNAVARAAGVLAIAALGVLLTTRFDAVLDARLPNMMLPPEVMRTVEVERVQLAGADLSGVGDPAVRELVRRAFADAYVAAFRVVMLVCSGLAAIGAMVAGLMVSDSGRGSAKTPEGA
jgi:EmrB/QacA subfamily drug resistance transporter